MKTEKEDPGQEDPITGKMVILDTKDPMSHLYLMKNIRYGWRVAGINEYFITLEK